MCGYIIESNIYKYLDESKCIEPIISDVLYYKETNTFHILGNFSSDYNLQYSKDGVLWQSAGSYTDLYLIVFSEEINSRTIYFRVINNCGRGIASNSFFYECDALSILNVINENNGYSIHVNTNQPIYIDHSTDNINWNIGTLHSGSNVHFLNLPTLNTYYFRISGFCNRHYTSNVFQYNNTVNCEMITLTNTNTWYQSGWYCYGTNNPCSGQNTPYCPSGECDYVEGYQDPQTVSWVDCLTGDTIYYILGSGETLTVNARV